MIQNGIEYERRGEQYYPLLDLGEQTSYKIGKYGKLHLEFIKKQFAVLTDLVACLFAKLEYGIILLASAIVFDSVLYHSILHHF